MTTMPDVEKRVVWVLGSGFSRALDGPLLEELLQHGRFQLVKSMFPENEVWQKLCDERWAQIVGHYRDNSGPKLKDTVSWRNAEEYVEYLELALLRHGSSMRSFAEA